MTTDKTIDQQLQELENSARVGTSRHSPGKHRPALLAAIWERTVAVKETKEEADAVVRHDVRQQRVEESREHDRERKREQALEQFRETMRAVEERSNLLLERIEEEKRIVRMQLEDITYKLTSPLILRTVTGSLE